MKKGTFIVIDGTDGSGKETQTKKLKDKLESSGFKVKSISFPRYHESFFGKFLGLAQAGNYGDWTKIHPKLASLPYAADRAHAADEIKGWLNEGYIVISDRYTSANQIHQGGKFSDPKERKEFLLWLDELEFDVYGAVRPDLTIYLDVSLSLSLENLKKNKRRRYTDGKEDQTENDTVYLRNSRESAKLLVKENDNWTEINCVSEEMMRSIEDIAGDVWQLIEQKCLS